MRRLLSNRLWICILAVCLGFAAQPARASLHRPTAIQYASSGGNSSGDPDDPMYGGPKKGIVPNGVGIAPRPGAGEGRSVSGWMWRLQTVLMAWRSIFFRS